MASVVREPIPLDNILQVAGVHVNRLSPRKKDEVFMCTAVDEIILSETFVTDKSESRTWTVYSQYDRTSKVDVVKNTLVYEATSKSLVVAIMGVRFHSVPFKALARTLTRLNTATVIGTDVSETNSEHMDDSGYQTCLPTPADDEHPKVSVIHDSFQKRPSIGKDQKGLQIQPLAEGQHESKDVTFKLREMFGKILKIPIEEIEPTTSLDDLGIDSLLVTEVLTEISKRFRVKLTQGQFQECTNVLSLGKCVQLVALIDSPAKSAATIVEDLLEDQRLNTAPSTIFKSDKGCQEEPNFNVAINSRESFLQTKQSYYDYVNETGFANFSTKVLPLQSELVQRSVIEAFEALGCDLNKMDARKDIRLQECNPKHTKLIRQLFKILEGGLVEHKSDMKYLRTVKLASHIPANVVHNRMVEEFPQHASENKLLYTTAHRLADCLVGKADPLALMFRDSAARSLLEDVYTNAPMFRTGTLLLARYLSSALERIDHDREIRILELGAGTGGTTKHLVEALAGLVIKRKFSYTFTDLSSSLVAAARRKFAKWSFVKYTVLDIEQDPSAELVGAYDIIVSINCIHATRDLVRSTTNIRRMLRPDALFIHGGGHIMLSRNDIRPKQTQMLLRRGFLPISVDYRLCPERSLTEGPMTDVVDALAWIRSELPRLSLTRKDIRVDAKKVVAVGWSTGGHLAMSLAWQSSLRSIPAPEAILAFYCPTDYEDPFWTAQNIPIGSQIKPAAAPGLSSTYELDDDMWAGISEQPIASFIKGELNGSAWQQHTINYTTGFRASADRAYLRPYLHRPNLAVFDNTLAERVVFDGKRATRVEVTTANSSYTLKATREVSGVGPAALLEEYGIPVVADRPGVGQNLDDQILFSVSYRVNVPTLSTFALGDSDARDVELFNANATGRLTSPGGGYVGYEKVPQELRASFSESTIKALDALPSDWPEIEYLTLPVYVGDFSGAIGPTDGYSYATLLGTLMSQTSRGNISISSSKMSDPPLINPNWLTTQADIEVSVAMFKRLRQAWAVPALAENLTIGVEYYPGPSIQTDEETADLIRRTMTPVSHASTTCKMGKVDDEMAVVDSHGKVFGVESLRVVDASAFPFLPPGSAPQAAVYMLAEKISDDVKKRL
ncbi:MAG: hypothetical protein Q9170_008074 [Blastenia crenularia]